MPNQVIPITQLDKTGLIEDMPSVSLPPNAFSNVENVRFDDGAVSKFPGEMLRIPGFTNVVYTAYWPAPQAGRHVVLTDDGSEVTVHLYDDSFAPVTLTNNTIDTTGGDWQHTLFNGGFNIILNNGETTPRFLQKGVDSIALLPGWDSYQAQENITEVVWEGDLFGRILIGRTAILANERFVITVTPRDPSSPILQSTATGPFGVSTQTDVGTFAAVNDALGNLIDLDLNPANVNIGDTITIAIQTIPDIVVTAGVVRAYGNLLVAGDLMEMDSTDNAIIRRALPGTIRTSDVAAPGTVPTNWNPFRNGVNTADEFQLATTGRVRDMVELQGVLYVYTDSSIHSVQQTGNAVIPFQIAPVTDSYGVDRTGGVIEVDGKHIVCGSNDVYVFAGHPGSISSIADGRVRNNVTNMKIVRFNKYDELWFYTTEDYDATTIDERTVQYIWDYRNNVWTKRVGSIVVNLNPGINDLLLATATEIHGVDNQLAWLPSFVERRRLALTPEFDTETLVSMALLADGTATLNVTAEGTNTPGNEMESLTNSFTFDISDDYKTDIRVHGRFLNYRIADDIPGTDWRLTGLQFDIGKGGQR